MTFLNDAKGYILHYAIIGIAFLDPSVQAYFASHQLYAMVGLALWGSLLHYANGKLSPVKVTPLALIIACFLCVGALTGCNDPYGACSKAGSVIASGIGQGLSTTLQLEQQGTITAQEAVNVAGYLEFANKADEAFLSCAQTAHTNPSKAGAFTSCATTFNMTLNTPSETALIHVANSSAQTTISGIVTGLTTGVSAVTTALGGA